MVFQKAFHKYNDAKVHVYSDYSKCNVIYNFKVACNIFLGDVHPRSPCVLTKFVYTMSVEQWFNLNQIFRNNSERHVDELIELSAEVRMLRPAILTE